MCCWHACAMACARAIAVRSEMTQHVVPSRQLELPEEGHRHKGDAWCYSSTPHSLVTPSTQDGSRNSLSCVQALCAWIPRACGPSGRPVILWHHMALLTGADPSLFLDPLTVSYFLSGKEISAKGRGGIGSSRRLLVSTKFRTPPLSASLSAGERGGYQPPQAPAVYRRESGGGFCCVRMHQPAPWVPATVRQGLGGLCCVRMIRMYIHDLGPHSR